MKKKNKTYRRQRKASQVRGRGGWVRNKNAGRIGGEAELSPSGTARPVSETRRFKSGGEEGQDVRGERGRERRGGGRRLLSLKYVDPRATLGLFSLHPAGCSGRIPVRPEHRLCISYDTKTSHYFPLSLDRSLLSPVSFLFLSSPRRARGHVTTIMLILLPRSP